MAYDAALPVYIVTGVFGALFIIIPIAIRKGPNQGIIRCCVMMTIFCMWIFWVSVYLAQMNPILGPRYTNTTLVWIAHSWGDLPIGTGSRSLRTNEENEMEADKDEQSRIGDSGLSQGEISFEGNVDENIGDGGDGEKNSTDYERGDNKTTSNSNGTGKDGVDSYASIKSNDSVKSSDSGNESVQVGAEINEGSKSNDSSKALVENADSGNKKGPETGYESRRHSKSSNIGKNSSVVDKENTKGDNASKENNSKSRSDKYDGKTKGAEEIKNEFIERSTEEAVKSQNENQPRDNDKKNENNNVDDYKKSKDEDKNINANVREDEKAAFDLGLQVQSDNSDSDSDDGLSIPGGRKINLNEYPQLEKRSASISVIESTKNSDVGIDDANIHDDKGEMIMTTLKTSPIALPHL